MNDDIYAQCISDGSRYPRIRIIKSNACDFTIKVLKQSYVKQGLNVHHCTDVVIRNVTATCQYYCGIGISSTKRKTVVVTGMYIYILMHIISMKNFV